MVRNVFWLALVTLLGVSTAWAQTPSEPAVAPKTTVSVEPAVPSEPLPNRGPKDTETFTLQSHDGQYDIDVKTWIIRSGKDGDAAVDFVPVLKAIVQNIDSRCQVRQQAYKKDKCFTLSVTAPKYVLKALDEIIPRLDKDGAKFLTGMKQNMYRAKFRNAESLIKPVAAFGSSVGGNWVDAATNILYYWDIENYATDWDAADTKQEKTGGDHGSYIRIYDQPIPQVEVTAKVYEITVTNGSQIGLDYVSWKNGPGRNLYSLSYYNNSYYGKNYSQTEMEGWTSVESVSSIASRTTGNSVDPSYNPVGTAHPLTREIVDKQDWANNRGYSKTMDFQVNSSFIDFLASKGKAKVRTMPRMVVANRQTGTITCGEEQMRFDSKADSSGSTLTMVKSNSYKVTLQATPVIAWGDLGGKFLEKDGKYGSEKPGLPRTADLKQAYITMDVKLTIASPIGYTPNGQPVEAAREVTTTVKTLTGMPVALGGLNQSTSTRSGYKVPLLGDLPLVGWLFGSEQDKTEDTRLIVVLETKIPTLDMSAEDQDTMERAGGKKNPLLLSNVGFDQMLLDSEYLDRERGSQNDAPKAE